MDDLPYCDQFKSKQIENAIDRKELVGLWPFSNYLEIEPLRSETSVHRDYFQFRKVVYHQGATSDGEELTIASPRL